MARTSGVADAATRSLPISMLGAGVARDGWYLAAPYIVDLGTSRPAHAGGRGAVVAFKPMGRIPSRDSAHLRSSAGPEPFECPARSTSDRVPLTRRASRTSRVPR